MIDAVREHNIHVVFSESTVSADPAKQVAAETGAAYGGVLYVDSLSEVDGPVPTYLDLLRRHIGDHREGSVTMMMGGRPKKVDGIRAEDVTVTYRNGHTALTHASFSVPKGTITALVGVNGAGKSTLFKAIMGFVPVAAGRVTILGLSVKEALKKNLVAYVPQAEEVDWTFPVLVEDVVMMGRYGHMNWLRIPTKRDHEMVDEALARVNMTAFRKRQDRRALGRTEKTRLPRPRARTGRPGDPPRRTLHRRRCEN